MPYAPGVQDISGQLLAQGMQARAQGIAGGVQTLFQGLQQNQMMTGQALARFQAATAANPKLLDFLNKAGAEESPIPVNPDILKAYSDIKSGKTNVQNTALLAQFADSFNQAEMAQQQQALRQAQMQSIQSESQLRQAQVDELRGEQARRRAVAQMLGLPDGTQTTQQTAPSLASVSPTAPTTALPTVPEKLPSSAVTPSSGVQSALGSFSPAIAESAKREAALKFLTTGQYSDPTLIAQRLATEQRKQAAEEREMSLEEVKAQSAAFNEAQKNVPIGQRQFAEGVPTNRPGYYAMNIKLAEPTALEKKQIEADTQAEKDKLARIGSIIVDDRKTAATSRLIAPAVGTLERLISEERLDEGSSANLIASVRSIGKGLGLPINEQQLADAQVAKQAFGNLVIPLFISTKGATSDKDAELFQNWSPQLGNNNKANAEMLGVIKKRVTLDRDLERLGMQVDSGKISPQAYVEKRQELVAKYDDSIPTVDEFRASVGQPPQTVAEGLKSQGNRRQTLGQQLDTSASAIYNKYVGKK